MPPDGRPRETKVVDPNVMSEIGMSGGGDRRDPPKGGGGRSRAPGTRKEDWIANQFRRVYDDALTEAIPDGMLDLLKALDDNEDDPGEDDLGEDGSGGRRE